MHVIARKINHHDVQCFVCSAQFDLCHKFCHMSGDLTDITRCFD